MFAILNNLIVLNGKSRSQGRGGEPAVSETKYLPQEIFVDSAAIFALKLLQWLFQDSYSFYTSVRVYEYTAYRSR